MNPASVRPARTRALHRLLGRTPPLFAPVDDEALQLVPESLP